MLLSQQINTIALGTLKIRSDIPDFEMTFSRKTFTGLLVKYDDNDFENPDCLYFRFFNTSSIYMLYVIYSIGCSICICIEPYSVCKTYDFIYE